MLKALQNSDLLVFVGDVLCSVGLSETLATSNFSFHHLIFKQLATNSIFDIFDAVYIGPLILLSTWHIGMSVGEFQISLILKIFCRKTQVQREFCIVYHIFNIFWIWCKITFQRESSIEHTSRNIKLVWFSLDPEGFDWQSTHCKLQNYFASQTLD